MPYRSFTKPATAFLLIGFVLAGLVAPAVACPGCPGSGAPTFCQEIGAMDAAVIARLLSITPPRSKSSDLPRGKFEITRVLKGEKLAKPGQVVDSIYVGEAKPGQSFLLMGISPPMLAWSTPLLLAGTTEKYLEQIVKLPKEGAERLAFYQRHLEHEDPLISRDAYDEFAKASYAEVKTIKKYLDHDRLVAAIKDHGTTPSYRRLCLVMLSICGTEADAPLLEGFLKSTDRKDKVGLDTLVFCYLALRGDDGMELLETNFLKNKKADYADTYAVLMGLRFQASDGKVVAKERLMAGFRCLLARPDLADLVIPDLARWEDWSPLDQMLELYKTSDGKSSWVRVPVVNYLRACPLPRAKELLKECEKIDPESVKRAATLFPGVPLPPPDSPAKAS